MSDSTSLRRWLSERVAGRIPDRATSPLASDDIRRLPLEVQLMILSYLPLGDIASARLACRMLADAGMDFFVHRAIKRQYDPVPEWVYWPWEEEKTNKLALHVSLDLEGLSILNALLTNQQIVKRLEEVSVCCVSPSKYGRNFYIPPYNPDERTCHMIDDWPELFEDSNNLSVDDWERRFRNNDKHPIVMLLAKTLGLLSPLENVVVNYGCTYRANSWRGQPLSFERRHRNEGRRPPMFNPNQFASIEYALHVFMHSLEMVDYTNGNIRFMIQGSSFLKYCRSDSEFYQTHGQQATDDVLNENRGRLFAKLRFNRIKRLLHVNDELLNRIGRTMRAVCLIDNTEDSQTLPLIPTFKVFYKAASKSKVPTIAMPYHSCYKDWKPGYIIPWIGADIVCLEICHVVVLDEYHIADDVLNFLPNLRSLVIKDCHIAVESNHWDQLFNCMENRSEDGDLKLDHLYCEGLTQLSNGLDWNPGPGKERMSKVHVVGQNEVSETLKKLCLYLVPNGPEDSELRYLVLFILNDEVDDDDDDMTTTGRVTEVE